MRFKLDDIIAAFITGFVLGFICCYFSLLSSEANSSALGVGFDNQGTGLPSSPPKKHSFITTCPYFEVSAYCPCEKCCGKWADGYTASGHKIAKDDKFVAASPDIPFGTLLTIVGYSDKPVPVLDRGSAITKGKLDVFFSDHNSALNWGRRKLKVRF